MRPTHSKHTCTVKDKPKKKSLEKYTMKWGVDNELTVISFAKKYYEQNQRQENIRKTGLKCTSQLK